MEHTNTLCKKNNGNQADNQLRSLENKVKLYHSAKKMLKTKKTRMLSLRLENEKSHLLKNIDVVENSLIYFVLYLHLCIGKSGRLYAAFACAISSCLQLQMFCHNKTVNWQNKR